MMERLLHMGDCQPAGADGCREYFCLAALSRINIQMGAEAPGRSMVGQGMHGASGAPSQPGMAAVASFTAFRRCCTCTHNHHPPSRPRRVHLRHAPLRHTVVVYAR